MRTHHLIITTAAAAALLALSGCSSSDPAPAKTSAPATAPGAAGDPEAARSAAGIPPSPGPQQRATYLAALNAIDPEIVNGRDDKAISRGLNQCQAMKDEKNPEKRVAMVERRFIGPTHPDGYGTTKSAMILAAVQANICPTY